MSSLSLSLSHSVPLSFSSPLPLIQYEDNTVSKHCIFCSLNQSDKMKDKSLPSGKMKRKVG